MVLKKGIKGRILDLLKNNKDWLTITEISNQLGIHHTTASKYLAVLEAEGRIECRIVGMANLFRIKK